MNNFCEASVICRGIHFDSKKAAAEFAAAFEAGIVNGLGIQTGSDGPKVSGTLMCLGYRQVQTLGTNTIVTNSDACLLKRLQAEGHMDKFEIQGSCPQASSQETGPVEHEGFVLDYQRSKIRDTKGQEHNVRLSGMIVFSLLSRTPQTAEEILDAYNSLPAIAKKIGSDTLHSYLYQLTTKLGKDVILRTEDKKIVLGGIKPLPPPIY